MILRAAAALALVLAAVAPSVARAQAIGSEWESVPEFRATDERFTFELRAGAYRPNLEPAFTTSSFRSVVSSVQKSLTRER